MRSAVLTILQRFIVIIGLAFWMGGFTFYAGVVIHVGHRVFGTMRETGFLTQQVTLWLNRSGAIVLALLIVNLRLTPARTFLAWRVVATATIVVMIVAQIFLFKLHPRMDAFLDASNQTIHDRPAFRHEHLLYMNVSTIQWAAALLHLCSLLILWRESDRSDRIGISDLPNHDR
jgi:hypothetical protein